MATWGILGYEWVSSNGSDINLWKGSLSYKLVVIASMGKVLD